MAHLSCLIIATAILVCQAPVQDRYGDGKKPQTEAPRPTPASKSKRPEAIVLKAIQDNPISALYQITTSWQRGMVVISGRVGSAAVHELVVRTAIDLGFPFRDNLIVDTSEAARVPSLRAISDPRKSQAAPLQGLGSSPSRHVNRPQVRQGDRQAFDVEPHSSLFLPSGGDRIGLDWDLQLRPTTPGVKCAVMPAPISEVDPNWPSKGGCANERERGR